MPALDFKEIPEAHVPGGRQDTFELLARDFFKALGFEVEDGPDRGQDGGRDLIIAEQRVGLLGTTRLRWLVSCKHKAHSGGSVATSDEEDIIDRVRAHNADGFMGFYSTVVSSPLARKFNALKNQVDVKIFDQEDIETALLGSSDCRKLAMRYFPKSFTKWDRSGEGATANFLDQYEPLNCVVCDKDLLGKESVSEYAGIVAWVRKVSPSTSEDYISRYIDFYWACKGDCDTKMDKGRYGSIEYQTSWEDISDIVISAHYVKWHIGIMNELQRGTVEYNARSFERLKEFTIKVAQLVVRNQTETQAKRLADLAELPPGI